MENNSGSAQTFDADKIEFYILNALLTDDEYCRNFLSKLSADLFSPINGKVFKGINVFYKKYLKLVPIRILEDSLVPKITQDLKEQQKMKDSINACIGMEYDKVTGRDWLIDETKKFIKRRRIMIAVVQCVEKIEKHKEEEVEAIFDEVFKINFDDSLGTDYLEDLEQRLLRSGEIVEKFKTGIPTLDSLVGGGFRRKSLFVFAGPANTGKTLFLNDAAVSLFLDGKSVLYLSLELSEDYIQQRTDAKFVEVKMSEINISPEHAIKKAIAKRDMMKNKNTKVGSLKYKEYSPGAISCNDIRALLKNLEIKKGFKPDAIVVDYLKLIRPNGKTFADNTYGKIVTVCEELRSLSFEYNCCVMTAAQTGRQSYGAKEIGMEDVSDSIGIAQTADVLVTLSRTKEMDQTGDMVVTVAKSRFSKNGPSFIVNVDYNYMRLVDKSENSEYVSHLNSKVTVRKPNVKEDDDEVKDMKDGVTDEGSQDTEMLNL